MINVVQVATSPGKTSTTVTLTLANPVTAGNALALLFADAADSGVTITGISGGGVVWYEAADSGGLPRTAFWYGTASGSILVRASSAFASGQVAPDITVTT